MLLIKTLFLLRATNFLTSGKPILNISQLSGNKVSLPSEWALEIDEGYELKRLASLVILGIIVVGQELNFTLNANKEPDQAVVRG